MRTEYINKYSLDLIVPISLIVLAEMMIFLGHMRAAMVIHATNLTLLVLSAMFLEGRIYAVLMLLPLFRLLNVAMPVFFQLTIYSYPLVYAPMFMPIYFIIKEKMFTPLEIGLTKKGFWFYLPLASAVGFSLGWGEYNVLKSEVLIPDFGIKNILLLSLTMILFVGLVEEFIFRSALQTVMVDRLGALGGLLAASILFGFMHSGYHLPLELLYVSFAGLVFGLLFWLTRSLPVISVAHGLTNISLFLVSPAFPELLIYIIGFSCLSFVALASFFRKLPHKINVRATATSRGFHEPKGTKRGISPFQPIETLSGPISHNSKEELMKRKSANENLLEKAIDRRERARILLELGTIHHLLGSQGKSAELSEKALSICREIGERRGEGTSLSNLGSAYYSLGETSKAIEYYQQALEISREIGDRRSEGIRLSNMGSAYYSLGETRKAIKHCQKALEISREIGDRRSEGINLFITSISLNDLIQRTDAIDYARAALRIFEQIESPHAESVKRKLAEWENQD